MNEILKRNPRIHVPDISRSDEGTVQCKFVSDPSSILMGDRLNLPTDVCHQCSNGARVVRVDVVLEEPPED